MGSNFFSNANHNHNADRKSTGRPASNVTFFQPAIDTNSVLAELAAKARTLAVEAELKGAEPLVLNANSLQLVPNGGSVGA